MSEAEAAAPLAGLTVADLSRMLPGAVVARQLLDLGARVIKVEEPDGGDPMRVVPPLVDGIGLPFAVLLAGAESITLDLRDAEGQAAVRRLVERSDVVVESFRPGTLERWGLSRDALLAANPRLVGCSLPAFSAQPDRVAHDLNLTAEAGVLDLIPGDGVPAIQLADVGAGLLATTAILAALLARERGGAGAWLDQSLESGPRPFVTWARAEAALGRERVAAMLLGGTCPCYRTYCCGDGRRLAVAALEPKFWVGFTDAIGCEDVAGSGFAVGPDAAEVVNVVEAKLAHRSAREWVGLAAEHGLPVSMVRSIDDVVAEDSGPAVPLPGGGELRCGGPWLESLSRPASACAPRLGEHAADVLAALARD